MNLLFLLFGVILGCGITFSVLFILSKRSENKIKKRTKKIYDEILNNLSLNDAFFNSRVNNTVQINTNIESEGEVNVMYFLDRQDISIFQEGECIYTSSLIDKQVLEKILKIIWSKFSTQINDVIQLHNNTFDKRTFMIITGANSTSSSSHVEDNEEVNFNLDDILDRINEVGYNNLTDLEKQFLKNLNK